MEMREYQRRAARTAIYPEMETFKYLALGLASEAGEVAAIMKRIIRDEGGLMRRACVGEIVNEIGDVLWYVSVIASELGVSLDEVAEHNLAKLADRERRDALRGAGDDR